MFTVKITPNDKGNPPGKLADAELHFTDNPELTARVHEALAGSPLAHEWTAFEDITRTFAGLKLIGFSIWERRSAVGRNVTFPARQYSVNGERRSFALLRPVTDATAQERVRDLILQAYQEHEEKMAVAE